jgi:hypothetical protein
MIYLWEKLEENYKKNSGRTWNHKYEPIWVKLRAIGFIWPYLEVTPKNATNKIRKHNSIAITLTLSDNIDIGDNIDNVFYETISQELHCWSVHREKILL